MHLFYRRFYNLTLIPSIHIAVYCAHTLILLHYKNDPFYTFGLVIEHYLGSDKSSKQAGDWSWTELGNALGTSLVDHGGNGGN